MKLIRMYVFRLLSVSLALLLSVECRVVAAPAAGKTDELCRALSRDSSFKVRTQAALLLGKLGDPAALPALTAALRDESKTVRAMAAQSLGKIGGEKERTALNDALTKEEDSFVRAQIEKAISSLTPLPSPATIDKRRQVSVKIGNFVGGSKAADALMISNLREALKQAFDKNKQIIVSEGDEKFTGKDGRLAYWVDGNVMRLEESNAAGGMEIKCEIKVMVARLPSRSVILWTSAGAAVSTGKREREKVVAKQDCIEATAAQLGESLLGYFKTQGI